MDEVWALSLGGDDYITKPYNVPVLLAWIKAVLRRTGGGPNPADALKVGGADGHHLHDFTATLISEGAGLVFRGLFAGRAAENACFDLYIGAVGNEPISQDYLDYILDNISVERELSYSIYQAGNS